MGYVSKKVRSTTWSLRVYIPRSSRVSQWSMSWNRDASSIYNASDLRRRYDTPARILHHRDTCKKAHDSVFVKPSLHSRQQF